MSSSVFKILAGKHVSLQLSNEEKEEFFKNFHVNEIAESIQIGLNNKDIDLIKFAMEGIGYRADDTEAEKMLINYLHQEENDCLELYAAQQLSNFWSKTAVCALIEYSRRNELSLSRAQESLSGHPKQSISILIENAELCPENYIRLLNCFKTDDIKEALLKK